MLYQIVSYFYYTLFHRVVKWALRIITGHCELLRITMSQSSLATKAFNIESSLRRSKFRQLNQVVTENVDVDEAVGSVVHIKQVDTVHFPNFSAALKVSLSQIVGYRQLMADVENLRKVPYSSDNAEHELLLKQLWNSLQPDVPLTARTGRHWTDIGFQGEDPATDFRGMGILGLNNLVLSVQLFVDLHPLLQQPQDRYFCTRYTSIARKLLSHSNHPQFGYSFAIVGINLTSVSCQLLRDGHLRAHFYNAVAGAPQLKDFDDVYVYVFYHFDAFWLAEKPVDIMQFNIVKDKFQKVLIEQLQSPTAQLQLNF